MADPAINKGIIPADGGFLGFFQRATKYNDIYFSIAVLGTLSIMLFPMPGWLIDVFLSMSIVVAILIILNVMMVEKSLDFNAFPTILLVVTLFRLAMNIATTRTILSEGHTGTDAAGHVVEAFGTLVTGGNVVIGVIVFIIITLINFVVITKGSGRIAEVAARFTLDSMPGKQMAIDADLSAGLIDEKIAKKRRKELEDESSFFGSMDGASKFVKGDAIAGIIITFVNFIGGIIIGVAQKGLAFEDAVHTYTVLTIGDGLVSQIPSLIISSAAGLLVTKSGVEGSADKAVFAQLGRFPRAMMMTGILAIILSLIPSLPSIPFLMLALLTGGLGYFLRSQIDKKVIKESIEKVRESQDQVVAGQKQEEEKVDSALKIDAISVELGYSLVPLATGAKGKLAEQIKNLRKSLAKELGFILPSVRIADNIQLDSETYSIKIKEIECARGKIKPDKYLVMDPTGKKIMLQGDDTTDPTFGLPAKWVSEAQKEQAIMNNYTVVPASSVITTHLTETIKENIAELLTYTETQNLIEALEKTQKKLVSDIIPSQITIGALQKILQNLLEEKISIRDLPTILEAIAEATKFTKSSKNITEHVRGRLGRQITYQHTINEELPIVTLSPEWEKDFSESLVGDGDDKQLSLAPSKLQKFVVSLNKALERNAINGDLPVIVTSNQNRPYVRAVVERIKPQLVVMAQREVHNKARIRNLGMV